MEYVTHEEFIQVVDFIYSTMWLDFFIVIIIYDVARSLLSRFVDYLNERNTR